MDKSSPRPTCSPLSMTFSVPPDNDPVFFTCRDLSSFAAATFDVHPEYRATWFLVNDEVPDHPSTVDF